MIKRTIYISKPAYLMLSQKQLVVRDKEDVKGKIPVDDIGYLILDHPQITITHGLIRILQDNNVVIISCDDKHMPAGYMLPLEGHSEQMQAQRSQTSLTDIQKQKLWTQCIKAKIINQAKVLRKLKCISESRKLEGLINKVEQADKTNVEGYAASIYWKQVMPHTTRDQYGDPPNNYLNYGYTILRAMTARALVSAGLIPTIGIHHKNKYNTYCLADDMMEAYRPFVDQLVLDILDEQVEMNQILTIEDRQKLLGIATQDALFGKKKRPLMVGIVETMASLRDCIMTEKRNIVFPEIIL